MITEKRVKISRLFYQAQGDLDGSQVAGARAVLLEEGLMLASIDSALAWAGISRADTERAGIIVGIDSVIDKVKESYFKGVAEDGPLGASPFLFPYTSPNVLAARATIRFGIKGPDITIASGPLSFLKAVSYAYRLVSSGRISQVVAAGVDEGMAVAMLLGIERSDISINSVAESRVPPDSKSDVSVSMRETFALFQDALDAGADASVETSDPSGNTVRIGFAFAKGAALKEEPFA